AGRRDLARADGRIPGPSPRPICDRGRPAIGPVRERGGRAARRVDVPASHRAADAPDPARRGPGFVVPRGRELASAQRAGVVTGGFGGLPPGAGPRARAPPAPRDRYDRHLFGQGLLLARRLIEADVPFVTVYWIDPAPPGPGGGEFDSHGYIYKHMRERLLPPADRALSALLEDLWARGLQEDTLVVVMSEFGRSPRLNKDAGRDHWPEAQTILLAGAGIPGGTVHGATDRFAAYPASDPVTPPDLGRTILHLLG